MVTVDPVAMQKRFDPETDLTLIEPALDQVQKPDVDPVAQSVTHIDQAAVADDHTMHQPA